MDLLVIGLSHRTAPLAIREQLHFREGTLDPALRELREKVGVEEGMILSTCNRVEVYARSARPEAKIPMVEQWLEEYHTVPKDTFGPFLYRHASSNAVRHLFRVSASLDSLVVGEPQIQGQVRNAFRTALDAGAAGPGLMPLLDRAMRTAKRIRTETTIAESAVSVSFAAVELARRIFGELHGRRAMLIGASDMGELAAQHFLSRGVDELLVTNRSYAKASSLAERYRGTAVPFARFVDHLAEVDVVLSATSSNEPILRQDQMASVMKRRRHRPIFLVDIAVPRDIQPSVDRLDNVYLYNIDDLQQVVESNLMRRGDEAGRAEAIIDGEVEDFERWLRKREVSPTIRALKDSFDEVREAELSRIRHRLQGLDPRAGELLEEVTRRINRKLLHGPLRAIQDAASEEDGVEQIRRIRDLFDLDDS